MVWYYYVTVILIQATQSKPAIECVMTTQPSALALRWEVSLVTFLNTEQTLVNCDNQQEQLETTQNNINVINGNTISII